MTTPKPSAPREFDEEAFAAVYQPELKHDKIHEALEEGARWQFEQDRAAYEALEKSLFLAKQDLDSWRRKHLVTRDAANEKIEALEEELKEARAELRKFVKFDAFLKDDGDVPAGVYESAVKGRQYFRKALREERARAARLIEACVQVRDCYTEEDDLGLIYAMVDFRAAIAAYESEGK